MAKTKGKVTNVTLRYLLADYNYACLCCGVSANDIYLLADHVQALSREGDDHYNNLQLLCSKCNAAKSSRYLDFRDPAWRTNNQHWSVAERVVRAHLVRLGRHVAWHPDYALLGPLVNLYMELWNCRGLADAQLTAALSQAEALGYSYPHSLDIANDILQQRAVKAKTKERTYQPLAPLPPPKPAMRKPRRVKTRLVSCRPQHQRRTR